MNLQLRDAIAKAVESLPSQGRSVRANEAALKAATGARRLLDHVTDTPSSKWVRKGGSPNGSILHLPAILTTMTHHSTRDICRFTFDTRMREHPALDALGRLRYERDVSRMRRTPT